MKKRINNIIITGDIHGNFNELNTLINKKNPEIIICCGDFGYWPKQISMNIKNPNTKILFCDGNHEDHWELNKLKNNEILPNVFYMRRGSTYTLPDNRKILFMGGANSIDKHYRKLGVDWFPEEIINQKDFQNLPDCDIDIFVTHTCPNELIPIVLPSHNLIKNEPSNEALSQLWQIYKPSQWFFGHWHCFKQGILNNITKWTCLSATKMNDKWWIYL